MARLEDLILRITADSKQLQSELAKVQSANRSAAKRVESDWSSVSSSIGRVGGVIAKLSASTGILGGLSFAGIQNLATDAQNAADTIDKLSNRLGISTTAIQEYQFAAGQAGIEQGELQSALQKLARNAGDAALGTGKARTAFAALGVSVRDASGDARSLEDVFEDVLSSLSRVEDATVRSALAQRVLGQSGAAIAGLADEYRSLIDYARELGIAIDDDVVKALAESQDASEALSAVLDQRLSKSLAAFAQAMVGVKSKLVEFAEAVAAAVDNSELLQRAFRNLTPIGLVDDLATVDLRLAETTERIEDLQAQAERFRQINPGQPAAAIDRALEPIYERLADETAKLKELWARRGELTAPPSRSSESPLQISSDALDTTKGKQAEAAAKAAARKAAQDLTAAQQRLNTVIEASFTPAERLTSVMDQLGADYRAGLITADQFSAGQESIVRQFDELDEKIQSTALKELDQILEAGLTPAERLVEQLDRIGQLYAEGSISAEQFALAQESLSKQLGEVETDDLTDSLKEIEQVGRGVFEGLTGALSDFVMTGKADLQSLTQSFASEFLQLAIKGAVFGLTGGAAGPLAGFFGGARAGGGPVLPGRAYMVGEDGPELVVPRSAGYVVPNGGSGGSGAVAAAPAAVYVTVNNQSRSDVQAREGRGPGGTREIEIMVSDLIARDIGRGGPVGRAIDSRLGVRPRGA